MSIKGPGSRSFRRIAGTIACALVTALIVAPAAWASTPFIDIHSAGPLSDIYIGNDLGCQVRNGGFSSTEFFPNAAGPGDCGTFVNTGSRQRHRAARGTGLREPFGRHEHDAATSRLPEMPFTPVSQTLTGSGTAASPYQVTTVVTVRPIQELNSPPIVYQLTEVDTLHRRQRLLPNRRHDREHRQPVPPDAPANALPRSGLPTAGIRHRLRRVDEPTASAPTVTAASRCDDLDKQRRGPRSSSCRSPPLVANAYDDLYRDNASR